jgi:hypothetical protein
MLPSQIEREIIENDSESILIQALYFVDGDSSTHTTSSLLSLGDRIWILKALPSHQGPL